jgi:hypothetical protein
MSAVDFQAVRQLVPLKAVLTLLGWSASSQRGKQARGYCPLHSAERHHSRIFAVEGEKWYCHCCKKGGDAIDLYASVKGLSLWRAAAELCELTGQAVPWLTGREGLWVAKRNRKRNGRGDAGGSPPPSSPPADGLGGEGRQMG